MWDTLAKTISQANGKAFHLTHRQALGGGCIHEAFRLEGHDGTLFFAKINAAGFAYMFAAEAAGLAELRKTGTVRCPCPLVHGVIENRSYLILEYIEMNGPRNDEQLGRSLAELHRVSSTHFGWGRENTIGRSPQSNPRETDWITFYREHRLRFQLELASRNGIRLSGVPALFQILDAFFEGYDPAPSLLHGDLWGGNVGFAPGGEPVVFDPACYFGDREADLAMTELFGGFRRGFYEAYEAAWPLDSGYRKRVPLYNLYHVLNHANLFGGGYVSQAQGMINGLLKKR